MRRPQADNPAAPPAGTRLCAVSELGDPGARGFRFRAGEALFAAFLVREGSEVRGWIDSCPHNGWPLAVMDDLYLTRTGDRILCAAHGAVFRLGDGVCTAGPCAGEALTPWPVVVRSGWVETA
jgi:nitrite reductase/ring-hydroxylating ferredoxin subunit